MSLEKMICGENYTTELLRSNVNGLINLVGADLYTDDNGLVPDDISFDNSQPFIDLCAAAGDGDTIIFGRSKTYHFLTDTFIDLSQKSINVNLNNSTLVIHDENKVGIEFHGGWSSIQSFTSIGGAGDLIVGGIPDTSLIRPRDIVRLTSDDVAKDAKGALAFQAEDIFVEEIVDSNSIRLGGLSSSICGQNNTYTTNPQISQRNNNTVKVYNGDIKHRDDVTGLVLLNAPLTRFVALNKPVIAFNTTRTYRWSCELVACLNSVVYKSDFSNGEDRDAAGDKEAQSSGLVDCSFGTRVYGITGKRVRHLVDTHNQSYGSNLNKPELYGSSVDMRCIGGQAISTSLDSFASHHQCRNLVYDECVSVNSMSFGFQCRGDVTLINTVSRGCVFDINIFDEEDMNPSRTSARIINHKNICSGVITNTSKGVPVNFYNYSGDRVTAKSSTSWYTSSVDTVAKFNGYTSLTFSQPLNEFDSYFGNNVAGTILFDEMDWHFDNYAIKKYRGLDVRGSGTTSNYKLHGDKFKIRGTGVDSLFRANSDPVVDGQLIFDLVMDEGVGVWGATPQPNDTNIQICGGGDISSVRNVNFLTERQYLQSGRIEQVVADFGLNVPTDGLVTANVDYKGLSVSSSYNVSAINNSPDVQVVSCVITADEVVSITAINKGVASRDMSAIPLKLNCVAI